ncbi:MAG: S8 family peptidase, partial [Acidobacteriota bacterium]
MANDLQSIASSRAQLLVRVPPGVAPLAMGQALALGGGAAPPVPLCPNTDAHRSAGLAAGHRWYIADLGASGLTDAELWEAAHRATRSPALAAAGSAALVEPDLVQEWPYTNVVRPDALGAAPGGLCAFNDQDGAFPVGPDFAWHLRDNFSQLRMARQALSGNTSTIRIGILDTGIDPQHQTLPQNLNLGLARNFVNDGQAANDVHDPYARGLLNNPGHGSGTLGLLAGARYQNPLVGPYNDYLGGAPLAEVVPIRIATSVILFRTSAFASGLDYLIAPNGDPALRADVVSMSMGGLASRAWADVINHAYEMGVTVVTAAGNNYPMTPSLIVFPALFRRVIAACGVMADGRPYTRDYVPFPKMAGNYGPPSKMATALSAYTPNTSWAEINCAKIVDMDGAGTSSATPQIAAAAALWLQKHKSSLAYPAAWGAVEAVREALFRSAAAPSDPGYSAALGKGILRASDALSLAPTANPVMTPADTADFALLRGLLGLPAAADAAHDMLELELTQVVQRDPALATTYIELGITGAPLDDEHKRRLIDEVVSHTDASPTLKAVLKGAYPTQYLPAGGAPVAAAAAT